LKKLSGNLQQGAEGQTWTAIEAQAVAIGVETARASGSCSRDFCHREYYRRHGEEHATT